MLSWIAGLLIAAVLAFFVIGPERVWRTVAGDPDMGPQNLETISRTGKPNDALLVPVSATSMPDTHAIPSFAIGPDDLFAMLIERIDATGEVRWVERDTSNRYSRALTFSPLMKFPDTNHIWVTEREDGHADVFLYAAAQLGQSDLGKNKQRLESWVALLNDVPQVQP